MSTISPFTQWKFEHDGNHLYYLPPHLLRKLEVERPAYLVGSVGTGKTTLLQALNWKERLNNRALQKQLPKDPFESRCIGVYLPLPRIQLQALDEWLSGTSSESLYETLFALYLDLNSLELLTEAVATLLAHERILASPEDEQRAMDELIADVPTLRRYLAGVHRGITLSDIGDAFGAMRQEIELWALGRVERTNELLSRLPLGKAGDLGRRAALHIARLCNSKVAPEQRQWHFKICMDEAEHLTPFQQLALNTIVRISVWPSFPVVSFVRLPEHPTATRLPKLPLYSPNRELILLDEMTDSQFRAFVEGVVTVRVAALLDNPRIKFRIRDVLGDLDLNALLQMVLKTSSNEWGNDLLKRARTLSLHPHFKQLEVESNEDKSTASSNSKDSPPIYQAYLVERRLLPLPSPDDPKWKRRKQNSATLRKLFVAAYLSICTELGADVPYASAEMVLQMSDKCVRDFLRQMDEIFSASRCSLADFLKKPVPLKTQTKAIKEASAKKRDLLRKLVMKSPAKTERLVDALAQITAYIQTHGPADRHLHSNERGKFVLDLPRELGAWARTLELLVEAAESGFLRMPYMEGPQRIFQVHTSLAAKYQFSYRGAQYPTRITLAEIDAFVTTEDPKKLTLLIQATAERLAGQASAEPLDEGPSLFEVPTA